MARFKAFESDDESDASSATSSRHSVSPKIPKSASNPPRPAFDAGSDSSLTASSSSSSSEDELEDAESDDSIMDEDELRPSSRHSDDENEGEPAPWAQQLGLAPNKVHVMQTSFFRMPELAKTYDQDPSNALKHPRSANNLRAEVTEIPPRTSFAQPRPTQPPARKYIRVSSSSSVAASHEGAFVDAGLSFGRSFRVGWGSGDRLVHVGSLSSRIPSDGDANTSNIKYTKLQNAGEATPDLLSHLLLHSPPTQNDSGIPYVAPNRNLTFASFSSLFTLHDNSHAASVFRLGSALFDPLELQLGSSVTPDIRNRIVALRRADALSTWLSRAVAPSVEADLKAHASSDSARIAFIHLTGNQVEKAVDVLTNGGNIHLATVLAQIPGDPDFREDIREQLQVWADEKVDALMSEDIRKLYALAAGEIDLLEGSSRSQDVEMTKGLDWLRILGLQLWYSSLLDTPLRETFEMFEQRSEDLSAAKPVPWYAKGSSREIAVSDGIFNLIKLALIPSMTLESTLTPLSFSPNPRDTKIPWLLYILLSHCLRLRDFTDRQLQGSLDDDESDNSRQNDGISQTAEVLTIDFASQLQAQGLVQEAAFVLMFLEDDDGRTRAIKELLARSAHLLDTWKVAGLRGSLSIPQEWIDEAKATHALYHGDLYLAYELFTKARVHRSAHELAVSFLAPEAILRDDLDLLRNLFTVLDPSLVEDFGVGGQLFIDYVKVVTQVPELRQTRQLGQDAEGSDDLELESLTSKIPKLIGTLPDVLRNKPGSGERCSAALSVMLARLLDCMDPLRPTRVDIQTGLMDEAARLRYVHSAAYGSFLQTIATAA